MMSSRAISVLLCFLTLSSSWASSSSPTLTICHTTATWVLTQLPSQLVATLLGNGVELDSPTGAPQIEDLHPVYLEFNRQHDCKALRLFPAPDMMEFKLQVPETRYQDQVRHAIYKPIVLEDSWFNVEGSRLIYGLPAEQADFEGSLSFDPPTRTYAMTSPAYSLNATLYSDPLAPWQNTPSGISSLISVNDNPWLCNNIGGAFPTCASNAYQWTTSSFRYRPAKVAFSLVSRDMTWSINNLAIPAYVDGIGGALDIEVELHISVPGSC